MREAYAQAYIGRGNGTGADFARCESAGMGVSLRFSLIMSMSSSSSSVTKVSPSIVRLRNSFNFPPFGTASRILPPVTIAIARMRSQAGLFDMEDKRFYGKESRLSNELRNFFRRRGIIFDPIYWRYERGKGI